MISIRLLLAFCITFFSMPIINAQSGWVKGKGQLFSKLSASYLNSDQYFNSNGELLTTATFRQSSVQLYAEYGIGRRFQVALNAPLLKVQSFETTESVFGVGDVQLELKYRLTKDNQIPVSLSIAPEIPTGRANAFATNKTIPQERINLPTGDGEWNVWTTLAASQSFGKMYVSVFSAYNKRTAYEDQDFQDLYQFGVEYGWNPIKALWLQAKLRAQFSTGKSQWPALSFVRGDATTYTLVGFEGSYVFTEHLGVSLGILSGGGFLSPTRNLYGAIFPTIGITYSK